MLFKVSWRNIWRNRTRSFVVIGAIVVGVWAVIFMIAFTMGIVESYVSSAIENDISHIQVHHPKFKDEKEVKFYLNDIGTLVSNVEQQANVKVATQRTLSNGMLSTSKGARGVQIRGIDPTKEAVVTKFDKKVIEGDYFGKAKKNPIIISKRLADKMKVKIRSKVVVTFQTLEGDITTAAFRVVGLYRTQNSTFDDMNIYVQQTDLNRLLGGESIGHEIAMLIEDTEQLESTQAALKAMFPKQLVENYREISPDVNLYETQIQMSTTIIMVIVMLALVFGIINTMLMAVLERVRELGMLMAVGMRRLQVFSMIMLETIFLGLIGAPIGLLVGYLTVVYFGKNGINLSAYSSGMQKFGIEEIVYPALESGVYFQLAAAVVITAILGALYPAWKAIRLKPVEAIHKI
ncbi:MAG: ABC transporter permease [Aureispira sp.]|nr:ABC transporter permease [Aureispira sp.]